MHFIQPKASFTQMIQLLLFILPKEILDPNILFEGSTVLHEAVRCDYGHATDSDPRVAQLLVCGFGANPLF
jgi:hypothetical protein